MTDVSCPGPTTRFTVHLTGDEGQDVGGQGRGAAEDAGDARSDAGKHLGRVAWCSWPSYFWVSLSSSTMGMNSVTLTHISGPNQAAELDEPVEPGLKTQDLAEGSEYPASCLLVMRNIPLRV